MMLAALSFLAVADVGNVFGGGHIAVPANNFCPCYDLPFVTVRGISVLSPWLGASLKRRVAF